MRTILTSIILLCCTMWATGQGFQNVTSSQNIDVYIEGSVFGSGLSFADFNNDGWDDLTFANNDLDPSFYINNEGIYSPIDLGIENTYEGDIKAILWVDYDNDGDKDLFVSTSFHPLQLYNNDGFMNFTDVAAEAGLLAENTRNFGASWGDYNKDGWLDLYVCKYHNPDLNSGYAYENHLYRSNQDGTFTEVANYAGVGNGVSASFQSIFFDYDKDGWDDIYVINDRYVYSNALFHNNGDGTFEDVSVPSGTGINMDPMCIALGDYDNDEDLDIYMSNTVEGNELLQNQGDGTFLGIGVEAGVAVYEICWGSIWIDYDNNMLQDLYVGTIDNVGTIELYNRFYENTGDGFVEATDEVSLSNDFYATHAITMGDINNDGFPDFVQSNCAPSYCQLYQNSGGTNNWLKVSVEGVISNRDGIGCWIQTYTGDVVQTRTVNCGEEYMGQDSPREMFGLGEIETVDSLIIRWPSGITDIYRDLASNQTLHVIEGGSVIVPIHHEDELAICGQDSVLLTVEQSAVSYNWSNGEDTQSIYVSTSGEYYCDITSDLGLVYPSDTLTVTASPELILDLFTQNVPCYGDSTGIGLVTVASQAQLTSIDWVDDLTGFSQTSLPAGTYWFTAGDANNCFQTDSITITQPDSLAITAQTTDVLCFGEATGEVSLSWTGGTGILNCFTDDLNEDELFAGIYSWECTDQNNCEAHVDFEIIQPDELNVELTANDISGGNSGGAQIDISGGTPEYTIEWSTGEDGLEIDIEEIGDFWVSVTDQNGCDTTLTFMITGVQEWIDADFSVFPNPFSNQITLNNESTEFFTIQLYSPLGELVLEEEISPGKEILELANTTAGIYILRVNGENKSAVFRLTRQ